MPFENQSHSESCEVNAGDLCAPAGLDDLDRRIRGHFAQLLGGQSPWAALQAWEDWGFHLTTSPGRQLELGWRWTELMLQLANDSADGDSGSWPIQPQPGDRRFRNELWARAPFNHFAQMQLAAEQQWRVATSCVRGVAAHHARRVEFMGRFLLNALAPVNFAATNPEVIQRALDSGGRNFIEGALLLADDLQRLANGKGLEGMDAWRVGENMALTEGNVIFRNELFELIQYAPTTRAVRREPVLIVPAWIMKYYILDLTPEESLVRYLVGQGFTVFIMSWRNPDRQLSGVSFEDYRRDGVVAALDAVQKVAPGEKVHGVGYCLGGTVLSVAAAAMDRDGENRLASLTLLAAQTDFEEAGELLMFIDESQLSVLEDMMHVTGYLDARKMAGAFYALRANEMLFAKLVERYLMGEPAEVRPMDAWLADPTRMPARMHSDYLRKLFMENRFAHGDYEVGGRALALKDIRTPVFALGAERDHIAPWRSVYKFELYGAADTTFILTGGGHNSSVVSPPGKARAYYWRGHCAAGSDFVDPDVWLEATPQQQGSWWPEWVRWLDEHSSDEQVKPPAMGRPSAGLKPLGPAPGEYVFET